MASENVSKLNIVERTLDSIYRDCVVIAKRNEALGQLVIMQSVTTRISKVKFGHQFSIMIESQDLLFLIGHHRHAYPSEMVDLTNISDQHRIFAFDAISDVFLLDIPKVYG